MVDEWVRSGWHVTATVRGSERSGLHDLADRHPGTIAIERVDVTVPARSKRSTTA